MREGTRFFCLVENERKLIFFLIKKKKESAARGIIANDIQNK